MTLELTRWIERHGKPWGSAVEGSRHSPWQGQWQRVDTVAATRRREQPASFRAVRVRCRHGETQSYGVFTKRGRLKRYGRKRLGIVHEHPDLPDTPRFLLTDALPWESGRVIETWSDRWAAESFPEGAKQVTGLEAAQVRQEEAVTRHCRLRGVAQSLLQRPPASGAATARCACAQGQATVGQRVRTRARAAFHGRRRRVERLLAPGHACAHLLEVLRPA